MWAPGRSRQPIPVRLVHRGLTVFSVLARQCEQPLQKGPAHLKLGGASCGRKPGLPGRFWPRVGRLSPAVCMGGGVCPSGRSKAGPRAN